MPELPEVETVKTALTLALEGRTLRHLSLLADRLRTPLDGPALKLATEGRRIRRFRRRGKFIILDFEDFDGTCLVIHLGMTGSFRIEPADYARQPHDQLTWELDDGRRWIFCDPRKFGSFAVASLRHEHAFPSQFDTMGPEPLSADFTPAYMQVAARGRKQPIKPLLLDQKLIAGIGNIYASEALFRAGIHPRRAAGRISARRLALLVQKIKAVLEDSLACGGSTIRSFKSLDGTEGHFSLCLDVYGKANAACPSCGPGFVIRRIVQAGRSTFYCPNCQR